MKNSIRYNYRESNSYYSYSPLPGKAKPSNGPVVNTFYPRARKYKSPDSTPTTSPIPSRQVTSEEVSTCFSDQKGKNQYFFKQQLSLQEKKIQHLEGENKRLVNQHRPEHWEKEILRKNEEIFKMENQLKYYMELAADNSDKEDLVTELSRKKEKITELTEKLEKTSKNLEEFEEKYLKVLRENDQLKEDQRKYLKKEECDVLLRQIQELEVALELQAKQFRDVRDENEKLRKDSNVSSLSYFAQDINKIKVEVQKLLIIVEDFAKGKEISLKGLLGIENISKFEPVKQISNDIVSIKSDLNQVLNIITDFHAEQSANTACRTQ
jgi:hypothetical protein